MVRAKRIILNYFDFFLKKVNIKTKRLKIIGSLLILVFVYSKVYPKHFLYVFKNRGLTSLPFRRFKWNIAAYLC